MGDGVDDLTMKLAMPFGRWYFSAEGVGRYRLRSTHQIPSGTDRVFSESEKLLLEPLLEALNERERTLALTHQAIGSKLVELEKRLEHYEQMFRASGLERFIESVKLDTVSR
jgi:hypothetical protein